MNLTTMAEKLGVVLIYYISKLHFVVMESNNELPLYELLIQPFELLLMDEPFSHLDKANTTIAAEFNCRRMY
jgi:hypothetical protein